jgi:hypothetical protein
MRQAMDFLQLADADVGIDQRRLEAGVPGCSWTGRFSLRFGKREGARFRHVGLGVGSFRGEQSVSIPWPEADHRLTGP